MAQNDIHGAAQAGNASQTKVGGNLPQSRLCPACAYTCHRQAELDRHIVSSHLPCWIFCPHSNCRWRGTRVDEFQRHLSVQKCGPRIEEHQYQIYNVKMILSWIKDSQGGDILSTAQGFAIDLVKERALELGKQEWLEDPWGRSERQTRRAELRK